MSLDPTAGGYRFDLDTRVEKKTDGQFTAMLTDGWATFTSHPNGGYVLGVALNALGQSLSHPDPLAVSVFFLRPGAPGAGKVACGVVRPGAPPRHRPGRVVAGRQGAVGYPGHLRGCVPVLSGQGVDLGQCVGSSRAAGLPCAQGVRSAPGAWYCRPGPVPLCPPSWVVGRQQGRPSPRRALDAFCRRA